MKCLSLVKGCTGSEQVAERTHNYRGDLGLEGCLAKTGISNVHQISLIRR